MGLREQILSAPDSKHESYRVEEWACDIHLKTWSAIERSRVLQEIREPGELSTTKIVQLSAVDSDGAGLFSDKDLKDLSKKNGEVMDRIAMEACKRNGLGAVEEAKKSSEEATN